MSRRVRASHFTPVHMSRTASTLATRLLIAAAVAAASVAYLAVFSAGAPGFQTDLDHQLYAARVLLNGGNPYVAVGPGRPFEWPWGLYHPITTLVALTPLTPLPLFLARAVFVGTTALLFGYAVAAWQTSQWRYLILLSLPAFATVQMAQWSFLLVAAALLPAVGVLFAVKPNVGAAVTIATCRLRPIAIAIAGGLILLAIGFWLFPGWLPAWLASIAKDHNRSTPVARMFGPLLLLAAFKWRRPEARILLALSLVPQTPAAYDALLLFLIPRSPVEWLSLTILSHVELLSERLTYHASLDGLIMARGELVVLCYFLPCLLMVLRRPNEGDVPAWMEWTAQHMPTAIRGRPAADPDSSSNSPSARATWRERERR